MQPVSTPSVEQEEGAEGKDQHIILELYQTMATLQTDKQKWVITLTNAFFGQAAREQLKLLVV